MIVRISIVLKKTVIFTFKGVPLLYCQFRHSQYCFAIKEKITRVIGFMFMSKRALYGFKYFFECELSAFNVKPYFFIQLNPGWAWAE